MDSLNLLCADCRQTPSTPIPSGCTLTDTPWYHTKTRPIGIQCALLADKPIKDNNKDIAALTKSDICPDCFCKCQKCKKGDKYENCDKSNQCTSLDSGLFSVEQRFKRLQMKQCVYAKGHWEQLDNIKKQIDSINERIDHLEATLANNKQTEDNKVRELTASFQEQWDNFSRERDREAVEYRKTFQQILSETNNTTDTVADILAQNILHYAAIFTHSHNSYNKIISYLLCEHEAMYQNLRHLTQNQQCI